MQTQRQQTWHWDASGNAIVADAVKEASFEEYLLKRQKKESSMETQINTLNAALKVLERNRMSTDPRDITLDSFIVISKSQYSENYRRGMVEALRCYLDFAIGVKPIVKIAWANSEPKRTWITQGQYQAMLAEAEPRDRMILILGGRIGLRKSEMANLKKSDVDLLNGKITITGKGRSNGKVVELPLSRGVMVEIEKWYHARRLYTSPYFLGMSDKMTPDAVYHRVKVMGRSIGLKVSPHTLRRYFATSMSKITTLDNLRLLMRHTSISTTIKYIEGDEAELRRALAAHDKQLRGNIYA